MGKIRNIKLPNNETYDIYGKNVENIDWSDYEALPASKTSNDVAYFIDNVPAEEMADENIGTFSGALATFDNAMEMPMPSLKVSVEAKQEGSGTPSPENVRPISGWSEVVVSDVGKNLIPMTIESVKALNTGRGGTWSGNAYTLNGITFTLLTDEGNNITGIKANGTASAETLFIVGMVAEKPSVDAYLNGCPEGGSGTTYQLAANGAGNDRGSGFVILPTSTWNKYVSIYVFNGYNANNLIFTPMVRISGDNTFAPYVEPNLYTIQLPQTVYGAEVDVVNGKLKILYELKRADSLTWQKNSSDITNYLYFTRSLVDVVDVNKRSNVKCSEAEIVTNYPSTEVGCYVHTNGVCYLNFLDAIGTNDLSSFNNFLTTDNVTILIPLASPIIINLTPTLIKSLDGTNNLSVDSGDVIEGEYFKRSDKQIRLNDSVYGRSPEAIHAIYADVAEKATQDESGNNIKNTYANSFSISDHTITLKNKNGTSLGTVTVPDNNTTYTLSANTTNNKITLTPSSGTAQSVTVPYATKATQDESGNNIKANYASSISISDHTITLKNKNNISLGTVTVPNDFVAPVESITTPTSLATFNASEMPMPKLKVSVEAKQDLHGYDKPWPAGGGKNKLGLIFDNDSTNIGAYDFSHTDSTFTISGTSSVNVYKIFELHNAINHSDDTYTFSAEVTGSRDSSMQIRVSNTEGDSVILYFGISQDSKSARITASVNALSRFTIEGLQGTYDCTVKVQFEKGSNATAFEPYSNICPISGWDEVVVSDVGKNFAQQPQAKVYNIVNGTFSGVSATYACSLVNVKPNTEYTLSWGNHGLVGGILYYTYFNSDNDYSYIESSQIGDVASKTFTTPPNCTAIIVETGSSATPIQPDTVGYIQVELGSTATTYEPYNGYTTTISLPQTVYGAEVDVVNGILKITDGYIASYNGESLPSTWISSMDEYAEGATPTTGAEVCYELAEPIIVNLTPTLIKSLDGTNNLSVDSGEVLEGEYVRPEYNEITAKIAEKAGTVLQKQLSDTSMHQILLSSDTTSNDGYYEVGKATNLYHQKYGSPGYGISTITLIDPNTTPANTLHAAELSVDEVNDTSLHLFKRVNTSSQMEGMTITTTDAILNGSTWDGTNTSLKDAVSKINVVNVTNFDSTNKIVTLDRTYTEIETLLEDGHIVVIYFDYNNASLTEFRLRLFYHDSLRAMRFEEMPHLTPQSNTLNISFASIRQTLSGSTDTNQFIYDNTTYTIPLNT